MALALSLFLLLLLAPAGHAQAPGDPIPEDPDSSPPPEFVGEPAQPRPVFMPSVPGNPHMAPNGRSNRFATAANTGG